MERKRRHHYSVEVIYREEFSVEADSKAEADEKAQEMFDDRDSAVWDAVAMGDPDSDRLVYEGYESDDGRHATSGEVCLTRRPKRERGGRRHGDSAGQTVGDAQLRLPHYV